MNLFYDYQYGFRSNHSTELASLHFLDKVNAYIQNRKTPISIYIDLSKAFDTIDHKVLLYKLSYYGFDQLSMKLCESYLAERKQFVSFNNTTSDYETVKVGVPQGSILAPYSLLFI